MDFGDVHPYRGISESCCRESRSSRQVLRSLFVSPCPEPRCVITIGSPGNYRLKKGDKSGDRLWLGVNGFKSCSEHFMFRLRFAPFYISQKAELGATFVKSSLLSLRFHACHGLYRYPRPHRRLLLWSRSHICQCVSSSDHHRPATAKEFAYATSVSYGDGNQHVRTTQAPPLSLPSP